MESLYRKVLPYAFKREDVSKYVEEFLEEQADQMVCPKVLKTLRQVQKAGEYTLLLSSSPQVIVTSVAKRYGFDLAQGTTVGQDDFTLFCGEAKARYLKEATIKWKIATENVTAYTDSIQDIAFLQSVGRPIVVNPDRPLRKIARKLGFEVYS